METELTKQDWENSKHENQMLIVNNKMQIEMAKEVIKLCDKKISKFPKTADSSSEQAPIESTKP